MDIEKIEKFIDAGYTKEEINKMLSDGNAGSDQGRNEQQDSGGKPEEPNQSGAGDQTHDSAVTLEMLATLTKTVEGLKDTVKALQSANANMADSGSNKPEDEIKNIMDSFINTL